MSMSPIIGLNSDVRTIPPRAEIAALHWPYVQAVRRAGAVPLIIPPMAERAALSRILERIDGLVLTGGRDLPPEWYGQEVHPRTLQIDPLRALGERPLAELALERGLPILGICLGCQLLNVVLGGDLIQDISSQVGGDIRHHVLPLSPTKTANPDRPIETFHQARVQPGSRLAAILGRENLEVNSSHHQAIGRPARGLQAVAWAPDGIVEALEGEGERFLLALQWHPERIHERPEQLAVFQALVRAAGTAKDGRPATARHGVPGTGTGRAAARTAPAGRGPDPAQGGGPGRSLRTGGRAPLCAPGPGRRPRPRAADCPTASPLPSAGPGAGSALRGDGPIQRPETMTFALVDTLVDIAQGMQAWVVDIRRELHQAQVRWKEDETVVPWRLEARYGRPPYADL